MDDNNLSFKIILGNPEIFIPKISILKLFLISEISVFLYSDLMMVSSEFYRHPIPIIP